MEPPIKPYEGDGPFVFICYSHADTDQVYPALTALADNDVNVWYDEGIEAGASWRDSLANAINECKLLIFFSSRNSVASEHCLKEVNFAVENGKPILVVYVENVDLPPGLRLYLGDLQHLTLEQSSAHLRLISAAKGLLEGKAAPHRQATSGRAEPSRPALWPAAVMTVVVLVTLWYFLYPRDVVRKADASVAVLPFDHWGEPDRQYISDGIADEITNSLTGLEDVRVAARGSAFSFRDQKDDMQAIGQALDVNHIVDGSVQRVGERIKVTSYLIDSMDGSIVWSDVEEARLDDVFDVQTHIAAAVLNALKLRVGLEVEFVAEYRPRDAKAYDEFLLGKHLWQQRGAERIRSAIELFTSAVGRDPGFARAWSALALAYLTLPTYDRSARDAHAKAEEFARKALEVDPLQAEAHGVLGALHVYRGELVEAGHRYRRSLELAPNNPDLMSLYEEFAADMGHNRESLSMTLAGYRLDPINMRSNMGAGWALTAAGRAEEGLVHFERAWAASRIEPVWRGKFVALIELERFDEAADWMANHTAP